MMAKQRLEGLCEEARVNIKQYKKQQVLISVLRLGTVVTGGFATYALWGYSYLLWPTFIVVFAAFLILVKRHNAVRISLKIEKEFLSNCKSEIEYREGHWRNKDDGSSFSDSSHPYINDLNIFGKHSLFQFLDRTKTKYASTRFAESLKSTQIDSKKILAEREVMRELSEDPEFILRLISKAAFVDVDTDYFELISKWVSQTVSSRSKAMWAILLYLIPAVIVATTIAYGFDLITTNMLMLSFLLPAVFVMGKRKEHQKHFEELSRLLARVDAFEKILASINKKQFKSDIIQERINSVNLQDSSKGIKELERLVGAIESRNNMLMALLLNIYFMWDFRCMKRIEDWKGNYGGQLAGWLKIGLEMEAYAPWALYIFNHPDFIYPELKSEDTFELIDARHVLMDSNAVANSLSLSAPREFSIITGANMAGKSTYLRTIGSSLILGMNGAPVAAKSFAFKPRTLYTSMLSSDSLGDNESYFFNELKRLRTLVDLLESGKPQFVILDEILKGTNSVDKAEGARKFLKKLLTLPAKGLVATHDLSLCELTTDFPNEIENSKFEVNYHLDNLVFDYKLEPGICQNMNANFLLKKMGLVDE